MNFSFLKEYCGKLHLESVTQLHACLNQHSNWVDDNIRMSQGIEKETIYHTFDTDEATGEKIPTREKVWEPISIEELLNDQWSYALVNPSGMGKTTFLAFLDCHLLENIDTYNLFPIRLDCHLLNNRGPIAIETFIENVSNKKYRGSFIGTEWENVCILLDGLDQAKDIDDIVNSLGIGARWLNYRKAKIIISSRENTADLVAKDFKRIRLKLPNEVEVKRYLTPKLYARVSHLINQHKELVTTPILLGMLKVIALNGQINQIKNRAGLYNQFVHILLEQERLRNSSMTEFLLTDFSTHMEKIALGALLKGEYPIVSAATFKAYGPDEDHKRRALKRASILLEFCEKLESERYEFRHQSFQSYFAAKCLKTHFCEQFYEILKDDLIFYNDAWQEIVLFYLELCNNSDEITKLIKRICPDAETDVIINVRYLFVIKCLPFLNIDPRIEQEVWQGLVKRSEHIKKRELIEATINYKGSPKEAQKKPIFWR